MQIIKMIKKYLNLILYYLTILLGLCYIVWTSTVIISCETTPHEIFENKILNHCYDVLKLRLDQGFYDQYSKFLPQGYFRSFIKEFLIIMPWENLCKQHNYNGLLIFEEVSEYFLAYVQAQEQILAARLDGIEYLMKYSKKMLSSRYSTILLNDLMTFHLYHTNFIPNLVNQLPWGSFMQENKAELYTILEFYFDKKYLDLQQRLSDSFIIKFFSSYAGVAVAGLAVQKLGLVVTAFQRNLNPVILDFMEYIDRLVRYTHSYMIGDHTNWYYKIQDNIWEIFQNTTLYLMKDLNVNAFMAILLQMLLVYFFVAGLFIDEEIPEIKFLDDKQQEKEVLLQQMEPLHSSFENISSLLVDYFFTITYCLIVTTFLMVHFYKKYKVKDNPETIQIKNNSP